MTGQDVSASVFTDPHGRRYRRARKIFIFVWLVAVLWAMTLAFSLFYQDQPATRPLLTTVPGVSASQPLRAGEERISPAAMRAPKAEDHAPADPDRSARCRPPAQPGGSVFAGPADRPTVFAFLPNEPVSSYLSALRHCSSIDVLLPELFEISAGDFAFGAIALDPEMAGGIAQIMANPASAPRMMPTFQLAFDADSTAFLALLGTAAYRSRLVAQIVDATEKAKAVGICFRLEFDAGADVSAVGPFLAELRSAFARTGRSSCVILSVEQDFWKLPAIVENADLVVVKMFASPWVGSKPGPIAPHGAMIELSEQVLAAVGSQRLVMAIGGGAVDWISGKPIPEEIAYAEALARISGAGAAIRFSSLSRNSYSSFVDDDGRRHQIWLLDAVTAHNAMVLFRKIGITNVALWPLGAEDPGVWPVLGASEHESAAAVASLGQLSLADKVAYTGEGPFYRLVSLPRSGQRVIGQEAGTGFITASDYVALPSPYKMQRYGAGNETQVALTFDDGPDEVATARVLDALQQVDAPATFFVVGQAALAAPHMLRRMVAEGHLIGSHTFMHPYLDQVSAGRLTVEMNALKNMVAGETGHSVRLFRPPYVRGPGPLTGAEAEAFRTIGDLGYTVVGSDIVPPDWTGISADRIVAEVIAALNNGYGNVVVLHDGRSTGMHTAEAIPALVSAIRAQGYEIVPLSTLLGVPAQTLMPPADPASAAIGSLSFGAISSFIQVSIFLFWLCLLAGVARSVLMIVMAFRRQPKRDQWKRSLPGVTIVIPAYNEAKVIVQSVRTALAVDYPDLKVIVVDDGSTDDTFAVLQAAYGTHPQLRILTQANQGKWKALNAAYGVIDTEIAVCMDADTQIAPDAVRHLVQPFLHARVGAVAGTVLVGNKCNLLTRLQALEYFTLQNIGRRTFEHINGIIVVPGALGAWRVEAVRDIGLFSHDTLTEDTDLTIWMLRGGYEVAYAELATGYTEAPSDVRSLLKQRLRWNLGMLQALWKHRGAFGEKSLRIMSLADLAIFGYALPLAAPLIDLLFVSALVQSVMPVFSGGLPQPSEASRLVMLGYLLLPMLDVLTAVLAFRLDRREPRSLLWYLPFQRFYYRQLMYISVYRAVFAAIRGEVSKWGKLQRAGLARQL